MTTSVNSIPSFVPGFSSVISMNGLGLDINLGVGNEERNIKQKVKVSFKLFYKATPSGCSSDNLNDTICYSEISEIIRKYCHDKEFKLLEFLCKEIYLQIKTLAPAGVKVWVITEKNPPMYNVETTSFEYTDLWE